MTDLFTSHKQLKTDDAIVRRCTFLPLAFEICDIVYNYCTVH